MSQTTADAERDPVAAAKEWLKAKPRTNAYALVVALVREVEERRERDAETAMLINVYFGDDSSDADEARLRARASELTRGR